MTVDEEPMFDNASHDGDDSVLDAQHKLSSTKSSSDVLRSKVGNDSNDASIICVVGEDSADFEGNQPPATTVDCSFLSTLTTELLAVEQNMMVI